MHAVRDCVEVVLEQIGVGIEGHRCRSVAEHLLHGLDVGAGADRQRRSGVAEVVGVTRGKAGSIFCARRTATANQLSALFSRFM